MGDFFKKFEKQIKVAIISAAILGIVLYSWHQFKGGPDNASKAYYTTDDGQTTFVDSFFKVYPFDHNGKPAYRAYMFESSSGKRYVAYLERYEPEGASELQALLAKGGNLDQLRDQIQPLRAKFTRIKAPNDSSAKWCSPGSAEGQRLTTASSPPGETVMMVFP